MVNAVVVVLGDVGRSPRMQYHAMSLANMSSVDKVSIIGFVGENCTESVQQNRKIKFFRFTPWDFSFLKSISLLHACAKGFGLIFPLCLELYRCAPFDFVIVQNPPAIPIILATLPFSFLFGSVICLDWHNLGFSMFSDRLGRSHILVKFARLLENFCAYLTSYHICVSYAMSDWLRKNFKISATVLYDRPPAFFINNNLSTLQRHDLLNRLKLTDEDLFPKLHIKYNNLSYISESTIQTHKFTDDINDGNNRKYFPIDKNNTQINNNDKDEITSKFYYRQDRAAIVISSTSWTADEDFSILLRTLKELNIRLLQDASDSGFDINFNITTSNNNNNNNLMPSRVVFLITGKGPLKKLFEKEIQNLQSDLTLVAVRLLWLEPEDYPLTVRLADLGLSFHTSTSGVDLPMKVLDMFGSGVPVLAIDFPCLEELVKHNINGLVFSNSEELLSLLSTLLRYHPHGDRSQTLKRLRSGVSSTLESWEITWDKHMKPIVMNMITDTTNSSSLRRWFGYYLMLYGILLFFLFFLFTTIFNF